MGVIQAIRKDKYYLLLFTQLLFFGMLPILDSKLASSTILISLFLSFILIAGLNGIQTKNNIIWFGVVSSVAFVITMGFTNFETFPILTLVSFLVFVGFYIFVIFKIIQTLLTEVVIKVSLIAGALAGYLMIGVILSFFFLMLHAFDPASLSVSIDKQNFSSIVYFSLVTMTTIGYGDIVPVNAAAQLFSAFGAIISQFYLAVVVAIIAGKMINARNN